MDQYVEEFIKVTSAPRDQATFYLDLAGGDLQSAIALYFDDAGAVPRETTTAAPAGPPPRKIAFERPEEPAASQKLPAKQSGESSSRAQPNAASGKPKIGSLNSMKTDDASSEDEDEGQAFYAGGSEHGSGQQIVGPKKAKPSDGRGVVSKLFSAARQLGAEEVSEEQRQQSRGSAAFGGAGYRLGSTADPSPAPSQRTDTASSSSGASDQKSNETEVAIKFWSNGFSINEGPIRAFDDPQNAEFLNAIRRGDVPPELRALKRSATDRIAVRLEDHHDDEYRAPKVTVKPFAGAGQKLVNEATSQGAAAAGSQSVVPKKITVNDAQPITQIQLRLPDGSRTTIRCNQSNSLRDVRAHLLAERTELRNATFTFISAFPGKPIENEAQTIKDAGLLNAALVVRHG